VTPLVTVVVVTWNGAHLLGPCLDALAGQTLAESAVATVVVDNASSDATASVLASYPGVSVVRNDRNLGFAGGATSGLTRVTTPYAVVLNNDARPEPAWLEHLLAGFSEGVAAVTSKVLLVPRYARLVVDGPARAEIHRVTVDGVDVTGSTIVRDVAGRLELTVPAAEGAAASVLVTAVDDRRLLEVVLDPDEPRVDVINSTGGVLSATGHGADRGYLEVDTGQYDDDAGAEVFAVCGAAAAFRVDIAAAVGWFDPWYFAYYEDLDLSWRLRRAGWRIRYAAAARVRHEHAATSRLDSDLFLFHNRRNRLATLARNASLPRMLTALAVRRLPVHGGPELLPATSIAPGPRPRGRSAALLSFLLHLPVLLAGRVRRSWGPDLSPGATCWRPRSAHATDE
jgi:GT2 family glycosyltransferase